MKRLAIVAALALIGAAPLFAQRPAGWKLRIDRSTSASDPDGTGPVSFVTSGAGFHATDPVAAVFWNPANTVTGNYRLTATFTQLKPSGHTNYYGLVFGGSDLDGPAQRYIYFMIAQDGTWLVKRRDGDASPTVSAKTQSKLVKKLGASGKATNALQVRVTSDKIEYLVNGAIVYTSPRKGLTAKTDGIYGIRVNHLLDVQIDDFGISK